MEAKLKTLAIIPARGGSKSIPHKNIYPLAGKPLIYYALQAVKKSRYVGRVIVSTDNKKIAATAKRYEAEVPFMRPAELALDTTPTILVVEHALKWLEENEKYKPEYILLVQPTEPFVKTEHIDKLFELVFYKKADSGITMIRVPRIFHPYHIRHLSNDGFLKFDNSALHYAHPTRQSDPPRYAFGNIYWFRRGVFLKEKKIEVGKRVGLEINSLSAHDINEKSDLVLAEFIIKNKLIK